MQGLLPQLSSHFDVSPTTSALAVSLTTGLLAIAMGMSADAWPKGLRALAAVAGLASLPVALQFHSDTFAKLLSVSGPLWIGWVGWASVSMFGAVKAAR